MSDDDMVEHEAGDAGASLEYPLEAGQVKKNGHIIMKGDKPCKVRIATPDQQLFAHSPRPVPAPAARSARWPEPSSSRQVIDIKVSKTGKHGHGKCRFTAIDIFDGSKHEDIIPSTHTVRCQRPH